MAGFLQIGRASCRILFVIPQVFYPDGTLDYFNLVDVKESVNEVVFYLEEKNMVPEKYTDQDTESKGFYDPVIVQDFPLRGKRQNSCIRSFKNLVSVNRWTMISTTFILSLPIPQPQKAQR